jgi:desulfoferrodoxin (superoxide reductase-like protein)
MNTINQRVYVSESEARADAEKRKHCCIVESSGKFFVEDGEFVFVRVWEREIAHYRKGKEAKA